MKLRESRKIGICFRSRPFVADNMSVFTGFNNFTFLLENTLGTYLILI